jgi:hypothetical protein
METTATQPTAAPSAKFDWLMAILGLWFWGGIYTDGWAHNHLASSLETFFTPWHAVLYSGFTVCALALLFRALMHRPKGRGFFDFAAWRESLPEGYYLSLMGAAVFAFGGVFDLVWHTVFGIEADIEALLSPSHLILAVGGFLMFSGTFRAFWARKESPKTFAEALPLILSMTYMISVISFMSQFAHPGRHFAVGLRPLGAIADHEEARAAAGMLLQTGVLVSMLFVALRRWGKSLPLGTFTAVFGLNALGMSLMVDGGYEFRMIPAAMAAGLLADWLSRKCDPTTERPFAWRKLGALVPMTYLLTFFVLLLSSERVWWSIHMWLGTVTMAGTMGLFLSFVAVPPKLPAQE